jgi:hypothetical protein
MKIVWTEKEKQEITKESRLIFENTAQSILNLFYCGKVDGIDRAQKIMSGKG